MAVKGHQDFWQAGSRLYFRRDPVDGVKQELVDLGVIQPVNPSLEFETVTLEDSDGGFNQTVAESVNDISETHEITCSNLNNENLSILWLAQKPEEYIQTAAELDIELYSHPGRLVKLEDSSEDGLFAVDELIGVYDDATDTVFTLTDIVAGSRTLRVDEDASGLSAGDSVIVKNANLTTPGNRGTYTVASTSGAGPTDIVVEESLAGDETGITGVLIGGALSAADFSLYNGPRGIVRMTPGGTFSTAGNLRFVWMPKAISGERLINPQTVKGAIEGKAYLHWSRGNFAEEHVREGRASLTPSGANFGNTEFSNMTLQLRFLSDLTKEKPSGRLLQYIGDLPSSS